MYFSFSIEVMVCRVTRSALANSSWEIRRSFRSSRILVFNNQPPPLK